MFYLSISSPPLLLFADLLGERLGVLPQGEETGPGAPHEAIRGELFLSLSLPRAGSTWNTQPGGAGVEDLPLGRKGWGDIHRPAATVFSKALNPSCNAVLYMRLISPS